MPKRDIEFFIIDMLVALNTVQRKISRIESYDDLVKSEDCWLGVTRLLEIIGEAMKHMLSSNVLDVSKIKPEWRYVVDFRNVVIHEYFGLNAEQVFDIAKNDVPPLEKDLVELLRTMPQKDKISQIIDQAIVDLNKTHRFESIDYLKSIKRDIL